MSAVFFSEAPFALKLPSPHEMAAYDERTIASGITSAALVERAGKAVADKLDDLFDDKLSSGAITFLCGPGNNGADGLVAARHLLAAGKNVHVFMPDFAKLSADCEAQRLNFTAAGGKMVRPEAATMRAALQRSKVTVDAVLGTGQESSPRGLVAELLSLYHAESPRLAKRICVSVDVPTGVNSSTGEVYEGAFRADTTIAIELVKRGMLQFPAREQCGDIHCVSIGIDCGPPCEYQAFDGARAKLLPPRRGDSHKGNFGRVLVIGGSSAMPGAPTLAAFSALRSGAGLVRKAELSGGSVEHEHPELLLRQVSARDHFEEGSLAELEADLTEADCVVIGPGLGLHRDTATFVHVLCDYCSHNTIPVVVDADALTLIQEPINKKRLDLPSAVLTPHPGEAARLLGCSVAEVQRDRYQSALVLHQRTQGVVILKGASSVIRGSEMGFVNTTGNPFMATAGSGDVLCGVVASLCALKLPLLESAACAAWIHGRAGDIAHARLQGPIVASDIIQCVPQALSECYPKEEQSW